MDKTEACARKSNCPSDNFCVNAQRVYDSCSSKEYMEDLRVFFTKENHDLIEQAANVRIKDVNVINVLLGIESVPFNQGFYAVDETFFFDVSLDIFCPQSPCPSQVHGIATACKRVILFGSEGNVKTFASGSSTSPSVEPFTGKVLPMAMCQVSEPIGLSSKVCRSPQCCDCAVKIPDSICSLYGGEFDYTMTRTVYVTIGLFIITQLVRTVTALVPTYDFCMPEREIQPTSDSPREMFRRLEFPENDFFPPKVSDYSEPAADSKDQNA